MIPGHNRGRQVLIPLSHPCFPATSRNQECVTEKNYFFFFILPHTISLFFKCNGIITVPGNLAVEEQTCANEEIRSWDFRLPNGRSGTSLRGKRLSNTGRARFWGTRKARGARVPQHRAPHSTQAPATQASLGRERFCCLMSLMYCVMRYVTRDA